MSECRKVISPIDVLQIAALVVGATGVAQRFPPMGIFDYAGLVMGFLVIAFDLYVFALRRHSKKR